jgi:hypothetical protein
MTRQIFHGNNYNPLQPQLHLHKRLPMDDSPVPACSRGATCQDTSSHPNHDPVHIETLMSVSDSLCLTAWTLAMPTPGLSFVPRFTTLAVPILPSLSPNSLNPLPPSLSPIKKNGVERCRTIGEVVDLPWCLTNDPQHAQACQQ